MIYMNQSYARKHCDTNERSAEPGFTMETMIRISVFESYILCIGTEAALPKCGDDTIFHITAKEDPIIYIEG